MNRDRLTAELAELLLSCESPYAMDHAAAVLDYLHPVIETAEELDALPEGSLFESGGRLGRVWAHSASALDGGHVWADKRDILPATLLHRGES